MRTGTKLEDRCPNEPVREAFLASGRTLSSVCRRLGWVRQDNGCADTSRLARRLGLLPSKGGYVHSHLHYALAAEIVEALDLDPVDVGV